MTPQPRKGQANPQPQKAADDSKAQPPRALRPETASEPYPHVDEATELDPEGRDQTDSETRPPISGTGASVYPGQIAAVRAPGWEHSGKVHSKSPQRGKRPTTDNIDDVIELSPEPTTQQNTRAQGASQRQEVVKPPEGTSARRRDEFRSVNEAAKELARAAVQAEIAREEKQALKGYEPEEGEIPPSPEVARRFDVILQLGKGGMSVVYLCRDPRRGGRIFAVKDIRAEMKPGMRVEQRVEHEAKLLKSLNHPGIVKVYEFLKFSRGSAIVMEYIDGLPLDHEIGPGRRISWDFGMRVLREIGAALKYAHDNGVIHRDIKPDNVLFSERHSILKLVDFGLARLFSREPEQNMTRTGMVVGTPHYMSPEQVSGKSLDQRSDIYSFGATLYYLLTGQRHVTGDNVMDILEQQRTRNILPPSHIQPDIPSWVGYIIGKMMEISPEDRYPNMAAVLRDLDAAEADEEKFLINPPLGPVKRYGTADLAPTTGEHEFYATDLIDDHHLGPPHVGPAAKRSRRVTVKRTKPPTSPQQADSRNQLSAMLMDISNRLERTEQRLVSPGAMVLIMMLSTLVVVLLIVGILLFAARAGYLDRILLP